MSRNAPGDILVQLQLQPRQPYVEKLWSEEILAERARRIGEEHAQAALDGLRHRHKVLDDDHVPVVCFHPGAGYQAAMSTGGAVTFGRGQSASYTEGPVVDTYDDLPSCFSSNNRWVDYAIEFWKGAAPVCGEWAIPCTPRFARTPLDLAMDLRGEKRLYLDLYDRPDDVHRLLSWCAESILEIDGIIRGEVPFLKKNPGGGLGVMTPEPLLLLNGDPLDLMSDDMAREFNNRSMEILAASGLRTLLHHHSIGVSKAMVVSEITALTIQQITQDPRGPRIIDSIDNDMVQASLRAPILLMPLPYWQLRDRHRFDQTFDVLRQGRFIVLIDGVPDHDDARALLERVRKISNI